MISSLHDALAPAVQEPDASKGILLLEVSRAGCSQPGLLSAGAETLQASYRNCFSGSLHTMLGACCLSPLGAAGEWGSSKEHHIALVSVHCC